MKPGELQVHCPALHVAAAVLGGIPGGHDVEVHVQFHALQDAAAAHAMPQPPQLAPSDAVSASQPSDENPLQSLNPERHVPNSQVPPTQRAVALRT